MIKYLYFFLFIYLAPASFAQSIIKEIIIPSNSNAKKAIEDSLLKPMVLKEQYDIFPDDTIIRDVINKQGYNIFRYGGGGGPHSSSRYYIVYHLDDRLLCSENNKSRVLYRKLNKRFFKELKSKGIIFTLKEKKQVYKKIDSFIKRNNLEAASDNF